MGVYLRDQMVPTSTEVIPFVPTGGVTKGTVTKVGYILGFAFTKDTSQGEASQTVGAFDGATIVTGTFDTQYVRCTKARIAEADKSATYAFSQNQPVYYNLTTQVATNVSSGNYLIGYAKEACLSTDTKVIIEFDGTYLLANS